MTAGWAHGEDEAWIRALAAGDNGAWNAAHAECGRGLYCRALLRIRHVQEAQDLVQETYKKGLLSLRRKVREKDDLPERLRPWLHRIVTNLANDQHRRRKRGRHGGGKAPVPLHEALDVQDGQRPLTVEARIDLERVGRLIESFGEFEQVILMMYFFPDPDFIERMSISEIARQLGVSEGKVTRALQKATRRLRSQLGDDHE